MKVKFNNKPGFIIDKTNDDGVKMVHIKYNDGTYSWECFDDIKMVVAK